MEHKNARSYKNTLEPTGIVGTLLRRRREEIGYDLATVARQLRIRVFFLTAIEAGDLEKLPGITYTIGFIRTYADFLGLDGDLIVADYHNEMARKSKKLPLEFPVDRTPGKLPSVSVVVLSLILFAGLYVGWHYWGSRYATITSTSADAPLATPKPFAPPPDAGKTGSRGLDITVGNVDNSPTPESIETRGQIPADQTTVNQATAPAIAATPIFPTAPATQSGNNAQIPAPTRPTDATNTPAEGANLTENNPINPPDVVRSRIRLFARQDSWIDIRDGENNVVTSRVLRQGEFFDPPEEKTLRMTTGNAGGLDIYFDGQALPALGAVGIVMRDIPLEPESLKKFMTSQGRTAPLVSPTPPANTPAN